MADKLIVSSSPHIVENDSTQKIMGRVIIAMIPALIAATVIFGTQALLLTLITTGACVGFEALYCKLMKKPNPIRDLSAVVTGMLLSFNLPPELPIWMAIIGAFVSIVIVKQLFGGIGYNFANPAIAGRIVLALSFTQKMNAFTYPDNGIDALASATPLQASLGEDVPYLTLLLGNHGGVLGETCAIALIIGGIYLVATKVISPTIPLAYIGTVALFSLLCGENVLFELLSGGLLLGAIFMATDYTTSPFTEKGRLVYGIALGIVTCLIRFFGTSAEGVSYAILLMNLLVPYINRLTRQKVLGGAK